MYTVLRGSAPASEVLAQLKEEAASMRITPSLAIVLIGHDPSSEVYVRKKMEKARQAGLESRLIRMGADSSQEDALERVRELNEDDSVHGFIVQSPLPGGMDFQQVLEAIDPRKDVDGWTSASLGRLMAGSAGFRPATPLGVMRMLEHYEVDIAGKDAVVIGRSNVVGKPMALMLMEKDATVTICHSRSRDLAAHTRDADILVSAVGRPGLITSGMVKEGAYVMDVGTSLVDGRMRGDADFDSIIRKAHCSPVPGGVGPMTVAMLLSNLVQAARMQA